MAKSTRKAAPAAAPSDGQTAKDFATRTDAARVDAAVAETARVEDEGRAPTNSAGANPAPADTMNPASGAFVEPGVIDAIPADHPSVENNPRRGTSSVQNGSDFNDPRHLDPKDPEFSGEGLDLSVYGDAPPK